MLEAPQSIIGRDDELRSLEGFLDAIEDGPIGLLLDGEAGIGKTLLWKAGLAAASNRSYRVLTCRPIESETELAYAALGDLLTDHSADAMAELPEPQRRALEVALLLREPEEQQPLQRAVAVATLGVLAVVARERSVCSSESTMSSGSIPPPRACLRSWPAACDTSGSACSSPGEPRPWSMSLSISRAHCPKAASGVSGSSLSKRRKSIACWPPASMHIRPSCCSSAFTPAQAEIPSSLSRSAGRCSHEVLSATRTTRSRSPQACAICCGDRLTRLPPRAREATEIAAALSRPTVELVDAAMGDATAALAAAAKAGVVELNDGRLRFSHPLLASVAYTEIPPGRRRSLHSRLAEILDDPEERGRHLALAAEGPDPDIAAALDEAAIRARARGAPGSAADLWEQARRLTPPSAGSDARRRTMEAAERRFDAGEVDRARELLDEVVAEAPPGRERALALARLGWVSAHQKGFHAAPKSSAQLCSSMPTTLHFASRSRKGWPGACTRRRASHAAEIHARSALALAESLGDTTLLAGALSHVAFLEALKGDGIPLAMIERAVELGRMPEWSQILGRPDWIHALLLQWAGELDASRTRFGALHRVAVEQGDEHALPFILFHLARLEILTGDWEQAEASRARGVRGDSAERTGRRAVVLASSSRRSWTHTSGSSSRRGRRSRKGSRWQSVREPPAAFELLAVRGFLELSLGNAGKQIARWISWPRA